MAGMEIFNNDDFSEDFLEINEDSLLPGAESQVHQPKDQDVDDVGTDDDLDKDKDKDIDKDVDVDTDDGEEVILPPSLKSDDNDKDKDKDIKPDSSTQKPEFFSSLVQALKEGGVLEDVEDDDIKSQEDFFKVIDDSIKQREFEDLTDNQKEYLEALRDGVPHTEIAKHQQTQANYSSITEEALENDNEDGEALRRNVIMYNYMSKGITEAKAKKLTDKIVEAGEDITESKDSLVELKETEKVAFEADRAAKKEAKIQQEKLEETSRQEFKKLVKETKEVIPGLNIPANIKNKVVKGLTEPVAYTDDKRPLDIISNYLHENPIDGRFKLAYLLTVTDNLNKMDKLENKQTKKNVMKQLEESMKVKDKGGSLNDDSYTFKDKFDWDNWEIQ